MPPRSDAPRANGARGRLPRLVALVLVLCLVGTAAATAAPPSPSDVAAQRAEADRLQAEAAGVQEVGDRAQARLEELAAAAGAALEEQQMAERAWFEAEVEHWEQSERLDAATRDLRASRGELGRWAAKTYREGPAAGAWGLDALLGATSSDDLGQRLALLEVVARTQGGAVRQLQDAAGDQAAVTADAEQTSRAVADAAVRAASARAESERLVAEQQAQVEVVLADLAQRRATADTAQQEADRLAAARALADEQAAAAALQEVSLADAARAAALAQAPSAGTASATGMRPVGGCAGGDVSWFANGNIPADALCRVWGAPGHLLRADAAAAFDRLATAWAQDHGTPLCVTDSYRPLADQVRLYATKPHLAARPGTSNHGWGVAVDLCGGIQTFGTAQHRWMQVNAPLFGWFHPAWARQGGSKPEAWHWEFGG